MSTDAEQPSTARPALARALLARRRARDSSPLLVSAYSLGVNSVLTAGLGMAFWVVAARTYPSTSVGQDSALLAAMMQISMVAQLNMANAVVRFMPGIPRAADCSSGPMSAVRRRQSCSAQGSSSWPR